MKQIKQLAFLMIVALATASCDMLNVDVETTMSGVLSIDVDEPTAKSALAGYPFQAIKNLDPQEDEDVKKYASNIVAVGVGNISAEVIAVGKDDVLILQGAVVTLSDEANSTTWVLPEDWPIEVGKIYQLNDQDGFYEDVSAILEDVEEFTIGMAGNSSVSGVRIEIKFSIDATATGSLF